MHSGHLIIIDDPSKLADKLAPYDEQDERFCTAVEHDAGETWTFNPNAMWDYWRIGGRWAGQLVSRTGTGIATDRRRWDSPDPVDGALGKPCDVCKIGDLDFEAMMTNRLLAAKQAYLEAEASDHPGHTKKFVYGVDPAETTILQCLAAVGPWTMYGIFEDQWITRTEAFDVWRADMGRFPTADDRDSEAYRSLQEQCDAAWIKTFHAVLTDANPNHYAVIIDCHI